MDQRSKKKDTETDLFGLNEFVDRATFLKRVVQSGVFMIGTTWLTGCSGEEEPVESGSARNGASPTDCGDMSALSAEERDTRELYGYVEQTSFPDSRCDNCSLYLPPDDEGGCGGCILFSGPVFAEGYCDYWAPIEEE